ncbi:nucleoside 2-deoxyribosyltransferase [Vibrio splendidus]|jgi:nucleoside 2-deoxyribosyltransferase
MATKKRVYFAAPLFSEAEITYNEYLEAILSKHFEVFLPQRDNGLVFNEITAGKDKSLAFKEIFNGDLAAIKCCDILFIVLDGRTIDEGACFELGYAFSLGKICIGLRTDTRQLMEFGNNPMIINALSSIFGNPKELEDWALKNG